MAALKQRGRHTAQEPRFEYFDFDPGDEEESPPPPEAEGQDRPVLRARRRVSLFPLFGVLAAGYLFVAAMTAQTRLLEISERSAALQSRIEELETEQARLRIAREGALNLAEIEAYATGTLGMRKPGEDQIKYIGLPSPDRAELPQKKARENFVDRVSDFLMEIGAYLAWEGE
ncbi:MAG: hypothetical protein IJ617_01945 [Oscillospiraceae bacterium]|nr:hypothetical protein [Oscillospiraceae bacterium]